MIETGSGTLRQVEDYWLNERQSVLVTMIFKVRQGQRRETIRWSSPMLRTTRLP